MKWNTKYCSKDNFIYGRGYTIIVILKKVSFEIETTIV